MVCKCGDPKSRPLTLEQFQARHRIELQEVELREHQQRLRLTEEGSRVVIFVCWMSMVCFQGATCATLLPCHLSSTCSVRSKTL